MAVLSPLAARANMKTTAGFAFSFSEYTSLAEVEPLWRHLEAQWHSRAMSCGWSWISTWIAQFGDQVDWKFVTGSVDGQLAGITLLTASLPFPAPRLGFRGIVHAGTAGERRAERILAENGSLLTAPGFEAEFAAALVGYIQSRYRPVAIQFEAYPPSLLELVTRERGATSIIENLACPVFDLAAAREQGKDVLSALGSGVRGRIRRSNRGYGTLYRDWATNLDEALEIFQEMTVLHQQRWEHAGKQGVFASTRFCEFHRETIRIAFQTGTPIVLFRLRNDEGTIGCLYGYIEDDVLLFYQSGFAESDDNRLKPGLSTHAACMQECMNRGLNRYNFLAGDSRYKRELSTDEDLLLNVIVFRYAFIPRGIETLIRWGVKDWLRSLKHWYERRSVRSASATQASDPERANYNG